MILANSILMRFIGNTDFIITLMVHDMLIMSIWMPFAAEYWQFQHHVFLMLTTFVTGLDFLSLTPISQIHPDCKFLLLVYIWFALSFRPTTAEYMSYKIHHTWQHYSFNKIWTIMCCWSCDYPGTGSCKRSGLYILGLIFPTERRIYLLWEGIMYIMCISVPVCHSACYYSTNILVIIAYAHQRQYVLFDVFIASKATATI